MVVNKNEYFRRARPFDENGATKSCMGGSPAFYSPRSNGLSSFSPPKRLKRCFLPQRCATPKMVGRLVRFENRGILQARNPKK